MGEDTEGKDLILWNVFDVLECVEPQGLKSRVASRVQTNYTNVQGTKRGFLVSKHVESGRIIARTLVSRCIINTTSSCAGAALEDATDPDSLYEDRFYNYLDTTSGVGDGSEGAKVPTASAGAVPPGWALLAGFLGEDHNC